MITPLYCCDDYKVDSDGFIISKRFNRPLRPSKNHKGYLFVSIMMKNGKQKVVTIHSAVAKSFLGDRTKEGLQVNHKDGNKENNRLDNLEWVTPEENIQHSINILGNNVGANNGNARLIRGYDKKTGELKYSFGSIIDCAKVLCNNGKFRQVQNCIWRALSGERKSYKGYVWKYAD